MPEAVFPGGAVGQGLTSADEGIGGVGPGLMENHGKSVGDGQVAAQRRAGAQTKKAAMQGIAAFRD
ncbi:hypothetical protein [Stenotrophomonas muris]|uniref:hypothetical protein n=1 Tax=Stenotrophomonas muris TaxID=2963283 RepID=UPI0039C6D5F9